MISSRAERISPRRSAASDRAQADFLVPQRPRLRWTEAVAGLVPRRPSLARRAVAWRPGTWRFYLLGRYAIHQGLRALGIGPGDRVLAPAYHCASAVEPILRTGAAVDFYNVRRDSRVDLEDLAARVTARTRAILAIHYFGFPQRMRELRELCDASNLRLIEDCAHVLRPETGAWAEFGDVAIFSWRKFVPVPDGGQLLVRDALRHAVVEPRAPGLSRTLRAARPGCGPATPGFDPAAADCAMTPLSRHLLARADVARIAARRRTHYTDLLSRLDGLASVRPLFEGLEPGVCPWVLPLESPDVGDLHHRLRARGVPAVAWDGVIHPTLSLGDYPDARYLYHHVAFLPVHQDLAPAHLETIAAAVAAATSGSAAGGPGGVSPDA